MKLIIQIPCYNEEGTLGVALQALPRAVAGFDHVEWLIVDDGSRDRTTEVAIAHGVHHVVRHTRNQGLARAFMTGLEASLAAGADVIVNTDADNQYNAEDIPALVAPILASQADVVIGARPIETIQHFSKIKRLLQGLGSWVVRVASKTDVPDAPSGFRALSRKAALEVNVFSDYTYTIETIIQAGQKRMAIASVPVRVNADLRPSRLVRSIGSYVFRSMMVIGRIFITYKPFYAFTFLAALLFLPGVALAMRFLVFYLQGRGDGHVQSVILSALLLGLGFFLYVTGILADLISVNRKLLEGINVRMRKLELTESLARGRAPSLRPGSHWERRDSAIPEVPVPVNASVPTESSFTR